MYTHHESSQHMLWLFRADTGAGQQRRCASESDLAFGRAWQCDFECLSQLEVEATASCSDFLRKEAPCEEDSVYSSQGRSDCE